MTWNGRDVPAELLGLPAGRYLVEAAPAEAAQEDAGLEAALDSNRLGPADDGARARAILETALERCRTRLPRRPLLLVPKRSSL